MSATTAETIAMVAQIEQRWGALAALCERYGVRRLDLFGSATTGRFDPTTSDLDFVVEFADIEKPGYASRYIAFAEALEALFGRPVDLLTEPMIRNEHFRTAVERTRRRMYERSSAHTAP